MKFFCILFSIASVFSAETFVFTENYRTVKKDEAFQTTVLWAQQSAKKKLLGKEVGGFGWAQYNTTYRQVYGGGYIKPLNWLQVGVGGGVEQAKSKARFGTFVYAAKSRYSAFAIYENGGSGYWYLVITSYDFPQTKKWNIGTHSQAFVGHGIRTEAKLGSIGSWTASIRPAFLWNGETGFRPNIIVGLRFTYFKGE